MATKITKIQVRRDTSSNWITANPTLSVGEIGFEQDTYKFKIGGDAGKIDPDQAADWNNLHYFSGVGTVADNLEQVLQQGNNAVGRDMHIAGINMIPVKLDEKVTAGGLSGSLLPHNKVRMLDNGVQTELVTTKPSLGDTYNRFPHIFLEGRDGEGEDFLVFGKEATVSDVTGSGSLSYKKAPTTYAVVTITSVSPITGEILSVGFQSTVAAGLLRGEGYYEFDGIPAKYTATFDPTNPTSTNPGSGFGATFNVKSVAAPTDSINEIEVANGGVGYQENEALIVALPGHVIVNYEGFQERIVSPLVTQRDLEQITTDSIPTTRENLIQFNVVSPTNEQIDGDVITRGLPEHNNDLSTQGKVNGWFWESLVYHEYVKPTVRDCVNNGPEPGGVVSPDQFGSTDFLRYDVNPLAVINVQGDKDGTQNFHADWGNYIGGKEAFGGEILIWDPTLRVIPNDPATNPPVGSWNFAFRPRTDATLPLEESDPIFMAHAAANIRGKDYTGPGDDAIEVTNHPMYKRESGALEPLMMVNNWKAIGRL